MLSTAVPGSLAAQPAITASHGSSNRLKPIDGEPIPKWLIAVRAIAITGAGSLFWWTIAGR